MFKRYDRWVNAGVWSDLLTWISQDADLQEGFIDSAVVRTHACAAGAKKSQADSEALGRSKGGFSCKIHALTDALGAYVQLP